MMPVECGGQGRAQAGAREMLRAYWQWMNQSVNPREAALFLSAKSVRGERGGKHLGFSFQNLCSTLFSYLSVLH